MSLKEFNDCTPVEQIPIEDYHRFKAKVGAFKEGCCLDFFAKHPDVFQIKKEKTISKNLERIFAAALKISNKKGFHAMTLRDLSREVHLSIGALYNYFSCKEELLEMMQRHRRTITARILTSNIAAEKDPLAKLRTAIRTHLYLSEAMQPWFYFSYMEAKNIGSKERRAAIQGELNTEQMFADIISKGRDQGVFATDNCQLTASLIKAMVQDWYLKRAKYARRRVDVEAYARFTIAFIENSLVNSPPQANLKGGMDMDPIDRPTKVRKGEDFSPDRIEAYLKGNMPDLKGTVEVRQYPSGASNLTYLLSFDNRQLVLRRPPFGTKAATAHDMGREYKVLSTLSRHWNYAPRPLVYCEDNAVIGSPFYVMEHLRGIILRKEIPDGLFTSAAQVRRLYEKFVNILHELHSLDYAAIGLGDLGKPDGYVRRQVLGWNMRYRAARTPDVPDCESIMAWLEQKIPPETERPGIIHNDFRLDNIVLDPADPFKIIGVLDWEMCTIGDPLMDLGCTLGYWVQKDDPKERHLIRTMPTHIDGALTRREFVDLYGRISGIRMDQFDFYYCFGLFRLAVIIQQIYYRFYHGQTQDQRAEGYARGVPVLERAAKGVIARSDL